MRQAILRAIKEWDEQWKAHSHVGSEDAAIQVLKLLNHLVDSSAISREAAFRIFIDAGDYVLMGGDDKLEFLTRQLPDT